MFTSTPPRNNCNAVCTNEENLLVPASAATVSSVEASSMQRKRGRSDTIMSTAMVSPFVMDQRYYYNNANSTSSSPMTNDTATTRLEPLIESTENTDNNQQQEQRPMPLSQVSTTSSTSNNNCASSSADPTSSSFHNDGTTLIYTTELQPPMKKVKVNNWSDVGGHCDNDVIPPLEEHKDDETDEMACQQPYNKGSSVANSTAAATTKKKSLSKLIGITGNSSNIVDVPLTTTSKMKDVASSSKTSQSSCCCHVCGGTGGDAAADDVMLTQCSEDIIGSGINNSGGSNCASRSIASYFQVTKKHSVMKLDPISSSSCSSRKVTSSLPPSSSSSQHKALQSSNAPHQLPPCRYCDRPTCRNNPSCIKQCEECQHNFCSFCCKVNYTGIYEKTVCFECDELIMLSHCCDRMELG